MKPKPKNDYDSLLQPVMTVKEFRKLAGKSVDQFSDEQVEDMIEQLDLIAGLFIKTIRDDEDKSVVPKSP